MTLRQAITFQEIPTLALLQASYPALKALFFDMDGTLFNTESFHAKALQSIGMTHHIRPPVGPDEVHALMMGKADHLIFEIVRYWENFPKDWTLSDFVNAKNEHLLKSLSLVSSDVFFMPAMKTLLEEAKAAGIYLALVTSSEKIITKKLLELASLQTFFDLEITRDDSLEVKPNPWPYLEAKKISGFDNPEIIIFEDSEVGLTAAKASGAHVIKVGWY